MPKFHRRQPEAPQPNITYSSKMYPQSIEASKRSIMDYRHSFWKQFLKKINESKRLKSQKEPKRQKGKIRRWLFKGKHHYDKENMTTMEPPPDAEDQKLLVEALVRVLARLPLPALFRALCVCRRWRRTIAASRFNEVRSETPMTPYFPLVISQSYGRQCCAFDFAEHKWQNLAPLDFVPYKVAYVGGAGGLLCLRNCFELLVVCNSITRTLRNLPRSTSSLVIGQCVVHMLLEFLAHAYKIIIVSGTGRTEVYESKVKKWNLASESLSQGVPCIRGRTAAFCNGFLYCIVDEGVGSKVNGIIAYDVQLALWSSVLLALPSGFGKARSSNSLQPGSLSAALTTCGNHVLLVAKKLHMGLTVIYIFELQLMTRSWSEVTYVPFEAPSPFERFKQGLRRYGVVVCEEKICLTSQAGKVAVFDMTLRWWQLLPECPISIWKNAESDVTMFPITPSSDVLV